MKRTFKILSLATCGALLLAFVGCGSAEKTEAAKTAQPEVAKTAQPEAIKAPPSDSVALQGKWKGQEATGENHDPCYLVISGNDLEFRGADPREFYKMTFALKEDAQPHQFSGNIKECAVPDYVGKMARAIYRLEGGTLTIAGNEPGSPAPPDRFDAPETRRFVFKKE
jgi:uncharacterized protein (TIGR03067 family)